MYNTSHILELNKHKREKIMNASVRTKIKSVEAGEWAGRREEIVEKKEIWSVGGGVCSLIYILRNKRAKAPCSISIFSCLSHLPLENWLKFPVFYLFQIKVMSSRRKRSAYTADRQPAATNTQITLDYMQFGIRHTCPTNAEYMIYFSFTKLPYNAITLSRPMMCNFLSLAHS